MKVAMFAGLRIIGSWGITFCGDSNEFGRSGGRDGRIIKLIEFIKQFVFKTKVITEVGGGLQGV